MRLRKILDESMRNRSLTDKLRNTLIEQKARAPLVPSFGVGVVRLMANPSGSSIPQIEFAHAALGDVVDHTAIPDDLKTEENLNLTLTDDAIFNHGDIGQLYTVNMISELVAEGKLTWDTCITEYFPEATSGWEKITIASLLSSSGGASDRLLRKDISPGRNIYTKIWEILRFLVGGDFKPKWESCFEDERVAALNLSSHKRLIFNRSEKLVTYLRRHSPGINLSKNLAGYSLASLVAERATGLMYEDLMKKYVFDPLEMSSAGIGSRAHLLPPGETYARNLPLAHYRPMAWRKKLRAIPVTHPRDFLPDLVSPGGNVYSNFSDHMEFMANQLLMGRESTSETLPIHVPFGGELRGSGFGWSISESKKIDLREKIVTHVSDNPFHNYRLDLMGGDGFWLHRSNIDVKRGVAVSVTVSSIDIPAVFATYRTSTQCTESATQFVEPGSVRTHVQHTPAHGDHPDPLPLASQTKVPLPMKRAQKVSKKTVRLSK